MPDRRQPQTDHSRPRMTQAILYCLAIGRNHFECSGQASTNRCQDHQLQCDVCRLLATRSLVLQQRHRRFVASEIVRFGQTHIGWKESEDREKSKGANNDPIHKLRQSCLSSSHGFIRRTAAMTECERETQRKSNARSSNSRPSLCSLVH